MREASHLCVDNLYSIGINDKSVHQLGIFAVIEASSASVNGANGLVENLVQSAYKFGVRLSCKRTI
jgi:hypothetical protein